MKIFTDVQYIINFIEVLKVPKFHFLKINLFEVFHDISLLLIDFILVSKLYISSKVISILLFFRFMGRGKDLSETEKSTIVRLLAEGMSISEIAKSLKRYIRTVSNFLKNINHRRIRSDKGKIKVVTDKEMMKLKRSVTKMPHHVSRNIFLDAVDKLPSRSTRCRILHKTASIRSGKLCPKLTTEHKYSRLKWAEKYMKIDWRRVIFSDECRVSCDGPDSFKRGWIRDGWQPSKFNRQFQKGGSVLFWLAIHNRKIIGPFKVEGTLDSKSYCNLMQSHFLPYVTGLSKMERKNTIFMQDNAPSHASKFTKDYLSDNFFSKTQIMDWPSHSPDLNPIENLFSVVKSNLYSAGTQYSTKSELWKALCKTISSIDENQVFTLTNSMDSRIIEVFKKKGGYINH